jgi:hypothetical protein
MGVRALVIGGLVAAAVALSALIPAPSLADCGGAEEVFPAHHPRGRLPPLAIGDSTMLLALDRLAAVGFDANAHGCRQFPEALALLNERKREGRLPHMVVIALGGDGEVTHTDIGLALGILCCTRLLVLVTPRELGGGSNGNAVVEHEEYRRHRNRIRLLDWVAYSAGHGDWFQPDGLHLTTSGAAAFTGFLKRAMPYAYPPKKHRKKRHRHHRAA